MGHHPTENYSAGLDDAEKQTIISQQRFGYKILGLCIKNSLTTDTKRNSRDFKSAYKFNNQDDGAEMLFVNVKLVQPDTHAGYPDIKSKMENMKMSHFKHDIPKVNLQIEE